MEIQVPNHLSRLEDDAIAKFEDRLEINDSLPNERVFATSYDLMSWLADFANYLFSDVVPADMTSH